MSISLDDKEVNDAVRVDGKMELDCVALRSDE